MSPSCPAPPPDPALPALQAALDEEAVAELLSRRIPFLRDGRARLERVVLGSVNYRPGRTARVGYALLVNDPETGERRRLAAHAFMGERARPLRRRWSDRVRGQLLERSDARPARGWSASVPELRGTAHVFPSDPRLPQLARAMETKTWERELRRAWSVSRRPELVSVVMERYHGGDRAVLRLLSPAPAPALWAKVLPRARAARQFDQDRMLQAADLPIPRTVARIPTLQALVWEEVSGIRLSAMDPEGGFLERLPAVGLSVLRVHGSQAAARAMAVSGSAGGQANGAAHRLGVIRPAQAARMDRMRRRIIESLPTATSLRALHGDLRIDQIIATGSGAVVVDFDHARLGDPLIDVGCLVADLRLRFGETDLNEVARRAFLEGYAKEAPVNERSVDLHEVVALLRLAFDPFRTCDPRWPEHTDALVDLTERRLESALR